MSSESGFWQEGRTRPPPTASRSKIRTERSAIAHLRRSSNPRHRGNASSQARLTLDRLTTPGRKPAHDQQCAARMCADMGGCSVDDRVAVGGRCWSDAAIGATLSDERSQQRGALRPGLIHENCEIRRGTISKEWELVVDGETVATVTSSMAEDRRFLFVDRVRRTEVRFEDGSWLIQTRTPLQPPTKTTVFGQRPADRYPIRDRTIELHARLFRRAGDSGEGPDAALARVERIRRRRATCVTAEGDEFLLTGATIDGFGRWRAGSRALRWPQQTPPSNAVLTVSRPVPLAAAVCLWHHIVGDFRKAFSGGVA